MVVHDLGSTDGSKEIAQSEGAEIVQHDCHGEFDDRLNQAIKNEEWHKTPADWIVMVDADELLYFPGGAGMALEVYDMHGVAIARPLGYEMFSEVFPTGPGQLYEEVKMATRDDKWYAKPALFSPNRVSATAYHMGAHHCDVTLTDGTAYSCPRTPTEPPCWLLHCHHIGPIERIARRYDENYKRQCAMNHLMNWGHQNSGLEHAQEKRAFITSGLQQIFP
jgi:hypothetical protein